ncbi:hypothetical protein lerEdw1_017981 [Lerista edwardsae]|nr:hypothetical protein lerEdw1_017981 [Lerista edwardsae]
MFSVRVVTADYYLSSPLPGLDPCQSHFREAPVKKVPVVRVFGATPSGQKTCLHLHGIFPYLYVPYDGYGQQPEHYLRHLAFSIDRALNVALGNPSSSVQHVFKVSLVYGMPFYGFHEKERQFMKIYLYNPVMVKSSLILEGVEPQSTCELEVDAVAADILNRLDIEAQIGQNPGLHAIWEDEKQRRRENKESSQISPPSSQDREFVTITESEKMFQKRLKEILKQRDLSVTLSGSVDYNNGSQELSTELSLHSVESSPKVAPCSPAYMVEVHRDEELNKVDNSADQAMVHLLAGLEEDEYEIGRQNTLSQHFSSGICKNSQNSDDEENEPQIEKEDIELSLLMSQRWDSNTNDANAKRRSVDRSRNQSSTEDDGSSEDEMDWSGNSLLLASLSIPQLDGTADENSDNPLNNESSRTHTSVIATSKTSVKTSVFHKDAATLETPSSAKITFQCKHTSALSSHILNSDDLEGLSQPNKINTRPEFPVHPLTKESTYNMKYPTNFNNILHSENSHKESNSEPFPILCDTAYEDTSVNRHLPNRKYTGIRKPTKDVYMHMNNQTGESVLVKNSNFSDVGQTKNKISSEENKKISSTSIDSFFPAPESASCSEDNRTIIHPAEGSADEDSLNNHKYEEFQEHKTEKTNLNQQAAHYMFFPSVVLSNCLSQPQKLGPVTYKLQQSKKQSRLKIKKKLSLGGQPPISISDTASTKESCHVQSNASSNIPGKNSLLLNDIVQVPHGAFENKMAVDGSNCMDCHFGEGTRESEQSFGLCGNKYTLRAKRKINYETEDSESSFGVNSSKISLPHSSENDENLERSKKSRKRRKLSKKLPPVIIKYIIINRFRGRKNMLVKLGKIDSSEEQVILTEEKMNLYKKLAPLKDFWPKVPDSPATKYPIYPLTPKKSHKRKAKCKTTKKRVGKLQNMDNKNIKRTLYFRKRTHAFLCPPLPSYSTEAEDCDLNYNDVMSKLGFLSERSASPVNVSPPRCWSPTDPNAEDMTNLEKDTLVFKNASTYSRKTVNPCLGKRNPSTTQVKKRKKQFASATIRGHKKIKSNLTNKPGNDVKKKPRAKQKQKLEKVSKLLTVTDEKSSAPPAAEVKFMLKPHDLPENAHNLGNSQPLYTQKDVPPTGYTAGHLPSAQLPLAANAQGNPLIYFHSLLENEKPIGHQGSPLSQEELHPAMVSVVSGREKTKINFQRSNSQSGVFRMKEPSLIQNNVFDQSNHISQVALNAYSSKDIIPKKADEITNPQSRLLSPVGKVNETAISSDTMRTDPIHPTNFLHCKDNQQQIVYLPEATKHDNISAFFKTSEESHGSFQLPKNCFVASLRSPVKTIGWEQKQRGFILDMSHFNPEKTKKQKTLSETISQSKTDSQCKSKTLVTPSPFSEGHTGLAVLKELLQKRQQKVHVNSIHEQLSVKAQLNRSVSYPLDQNKSIKRLRSVTSPRKPRIPKDKKSKEKTLKLLKDSGKQQNNIKTAMSVDSPVFYSDPGFESCYSLEDSLSPDHNYNFDINAIGQTGFCSLYSASQFVPADQNLPQKFLSDATQDLFPGHLAETELLSHSSKMSKEENHYSDPTTWLRSGPLSPQLFDKRCLDNSENCLHNQWKNNVLPSTSQPNSPVNMQQTEMSQKEQFQLDRNAVKKGIFLNLSSPNNDWNHNHFRKDSTFEPSQSLDSVSISFSSILSSPDGELMDAASEDLELYSSRNNEGLTPTPNSSPRSTNSPSQSKNGNSTPRAAHILKPLMSPPSREEIMSTLLDHDLAETIYQEPFCSNPSDAPEKPRKNNLTRYLHREIGGRLLTVETRLPNDLLEFEGDFSLEGLRLWKTAFLAMAQSPRPGSPLRNSQLTTEKKQRNSRKTSEDKKIVIMPCKCAPSCQQIQSWLQAKEDYEHFRKQMVIKPTEIEKVAETVNCPSLPENLCSEKAKAAENYSLSSLQVSKSVVHAEDFCFSSSSPAPAQTIEECDTNTTEMNTFAVAKKTIPLVTSVERDEEDYVNCSSPDSLALPPWQQVASSDSKHSSSADLEDLLSPVEENEKLTQTLVKEEGKIPYSISPVVSKESNGYSETVCLHSTPVREKICQGRIPEALGFTPLLPGPKTQKLNRRRGSNAGTLRKVLLTTQVKNQFIASNAPKKDTSQIEGPSLNNSYGFKISVQNLQEAKTLHEVTENMPLCLQDLVSQDWKLPMLLMREHFSRRKLLMRMALTKSRKPEYKRVAESNQHRVGPDEAADSCSEKTKLQSRIGKDFSEPFKLVEKKFKVKIMEARYDPDILLGYEVQMHSWGYLLQRAAALDVDLCQMISRVPDDKKENRFAQERDEYGSDTMSEINIVGRVVLNVWRIMRNELEEDCLIDQLCPSPWTIGRTQMGLEQPSEVPLVLASDLDFLFDEYRVESMMLRIAKPMNYIAVTPSVQQRAQMRAPQCIPLIMEPESRFYSNTVLVLDFQSLYPSIVIAYNYCYSTCLGHIENLGKYDEFKFGCTSLRVCPDLLYQLRHDITVSPCGVAFVKIGDSIVHKARETLERAIKLVNDTKKWGARVVYGDTDSMFVLLKGATKEQSFKIGQEIAEAVTATNPKPVKLKFEKVYLPCILQTKKRYVGYMYEALDQKDPVFDAKGIETVRRDSCPAVSKILERSIKLLFETRDISQIKQYVQNQCMKLLEGKASMQDFIFAKEYRGISAYRPGACVPALEITRRMLAYDRRSEPRVGERVPYVIVYGMPGLPLIQLVRRPIEVLQDPNLRLNATYYITKQILPPLARVLSLIGIDVFSWYHELPRIQKAATTSHNEQENRKGTISQYFTTLRCPVCDELTQHGICSKCRNQPQHVVAILNQEIRELERKHEHLVKIP